VASPLQWLSQPAPRSDDSYTYNRTSSVKFRKKNVCYKIYVPPQTNNHLCISCMLGHFQTLITSNFIPAVARTRS
jgi:hypothetical protein